ncbi:hypothetical protein NDU88_000799 [Pleurodeles waltl]|uniref:Uncharacterized protein n=1 Tax=Pleurodeles waltl TaxID=8319 RepID=A0AAV7KR05_PLEWA|nr:hypothetical protein NDU88_000799 [Pleurodeles waltl]
MGGGWGDRLIVDRKSCLDTLGRVAGGGLGVEEEVVVVGGVRFVVLGAGTCAEGCGEVDVCWVGVCLRLCIFGRGVTDTLGEDTGDVGMVVGVVTARERGVLVRDVVAVKVVHAGVGVDETGREEGDDEEGDTVEAVDVGVSVCV